MQKNVYGIACGLAVAAIVVGAGAYFWKSQFTISGHVTYNGAPLAKAGQVVFVSPDGTQTAAPIGPDGAYRATKVPGGLNRVAVYCPNPAAKNAKRRPPPGEPAPPPVAPFLTPFQYASVETSGIEVQLDDDRVFNIELNGPPVP